MPEIEMALAPEQIRARNAAVVIETWHSENKFRELLELYHEGEMPASCAEGIQRNDLIVIFYGNRGDGKKLGCVVAVGKKGVAVLEPAHRPVVLAKREQRDPV